jgi:hypothetical protein
MPNVNDIYKKNEDDWVSRFILDEVVIMPLCRSEEDMQYIYSIANQTGVRIFQLLDGKHSVKEIQDVLKREFQEKNEEIIEGEVLTFIEDLSSVKLIEKVRRAGALKGDVSDKRDEGRVSSKKKPYEAPELIKVRMQPEQAVLSCCLNDTQPKTSFDPVNFPFNYCTYNGQPCPPTNGCVGRYSYLWTYALPS